MNDIFLLVVEALARITISALLCCWQGSEVVDLCLINRGVDLVRSILFTSDSEVLVSGSLINRAVTIFAVFLWLICNRVPCLYFKANQLVFMAVKFESVYTNVLINTYTLLSTEITLV